MRKKKDKGEEGGEEKERKKPGEPDIELLSLLLRRNKEEMVFVSQKTVTKSSLISSSL